MPSNFEEYEEDFKVRAICERYVEKIVEAIIDLAFIIAGEKTIKSPNDEKEIFDILEKENIISKDLSQKLKEAKGMRNIIAHQYGDIDNEIVFQAVTEELIPDAKAFLEEIKKI